MAVPIAELFISVSADVNGAISGLNALSTKLNSTTNSFQTARPAALALTAAAVGIGTAFLGSVKEAATFEQAMANVRAVMSPSEAKQFGSAMDDLALSLGEQTSFNAMQVAAGLKEMLKAGFNAEDVLGGAAAAVLNLAAATDTGVTESATLAAQSLSAFGLSVKDLPGVVNTLAGVSVTTAADMHDMSQAISDAGGTAKAAGLSFGEFATTIGIFRQHGISANASGTALKTMLTRLVPNTKAEVKAFDQLGLTVGGANNVFFDAQGHFLGMANASQQLKRALGGMNEQQRIAFITTAFGTEAIQGINALVDEGADGFNKYAAAIGQISATELAAARINTLFGAMDQLGGVIQSISIRIGRLFAPEIRAIVDAVTGAVRAFSNLTPEQQRFIALFVAGAGAVAGAVGGFVLLKPLIASMGTSFAALGKILLAVSVPFKILAALAGLLFVAWEKDLGGIRGIVSNVFGALPGILDKVKDLLAQAGDFWEATIAPALQNIVDTVIVKFGEIAAAVQASDLGQAVGAAFGVVSDVFQAIMDGRGQEILDFFGNLLPQPFKDLGAVVGSTVSDAFGVISDVFQAIIDGRGGEIVDFFANLLPQPLKDLGAAIGPQIISAFGVISDVFQAIIDGRGGEIIDFFKNLLPQPFKDLGAAIGPQVAAAFGVISDVFEAILSGRGNEILDFFANKLPEPLKALGASIGENVTHAFDTISAIFTQIVSGNGQQVVDFFRSLLPQALQEFIDKAGEGPAVINKLAESIKTIQTAIGGFDPAQLATVGEAIGGSFLNTLGQIGTQLAPLLTVFQSVGTFLQSVANVFSAFADLRARQTAAGEGGAAEDPLVSHLQRLADFMVNNGGLGDNFLRMLGPFGPGLAAISAGGPGAASAFDAMATALNNFATAIRNFPTLPDWLQRFMQDPTGTAAATGFQAGTAAGTNLNNAGAPGPGGGPSFAAVAADIGRSGPLINIGQLLISNEAEAQAFLSRMASAISGAAGRVNAPPDNSGNPQLMPVAP